MLFQLLKTCPHLVVLGLSGYFILHLERGRQQYRARWCYP